MKPFMWDGRGTRIGVSAGRWVGVGIGAWLGGDWVGRGSVRAGASGVVLCMA